MKFLIISPHLDDALFSLSSILKDAHHIVIATVFTQECPFEHLTGDYAAYGDMKTRKQEDLSAIAFLNKNPGTKAAKAKVKAKVEYIHLNYPDKLFRKNNTPYVLSLLDSMRELDTRNFDRVYCPLGVGEHPDHVFVYDICQNVFGNSALYYCEYPYSVLKLNMVKRFNRLGLKHNLKLNWRDYSAYYRHPIYASTFWGLRFLRLFRSFFNRRTIRIRQDEHEMNDVEFKYTLVSHYKSQIGPIFGSMDRLKKELQTEKKECIVHFV